MRDSLIHEQVFFDFVKNHDILQHLKYSENTIETQKIIGLQVDGEPGEDNELFVPYVKQLMKQSDVVVIDPNYDEIYNSFSNIDYASDSVEYINNLFDSTETKEELLEVILNLIIKKLIASNIDAKKVYFRVKPYWNTEWCDEVIEVK
jgi:hypothetical protein